MMLTCFFFLLLFTDSALSQCTYRDVVQHLNLTKEKDLWTLTQPVNNISEPLKLQLDVLLYAILEVNEKDQHFESYIWVDVTWRDKFLSWNSSEFCGIDKINIPTTSVWTPDLTIAEMTEKDKAGPSPYLKVFSDGDMWLREDMVVVSTCRMHVFKFPFDTQKCNLTFKSIIHSDESIKLSQSGDNQRITGWSQKMMQSKTEWEFINMTSSIQNEDNFGINQSMVVYTITMKRRPILYIINFILPVLLLWSLDMASFMMPEDGGKVGFKISVLLAVILMQLLLNEILPASSNRIPMIVVFCISIFGLMMLSLLETILVMYLMGKDSAPKDKEEDNQNLSEECGEKEGSTKLCSCFRGLELVLCASTSDWPSGETSSELLQVEKEVSHKQQSEGPNDEENSVIKALSLLRNMLDTEKIGYWTRLAQRIHKG
ncbi:5-hydroxytryptamine receptor 3A-like [Halichoeres trimaculatus]|uniref:5-hydroxytryptamine receptor 3A-like n=1 Tax=Halichoeres trimaculatus TaxID=147232 RepID=UPI003D9EFC6C